MTSTNSLYPLSPGNGKRHSVWEYRLHLLCALVLGLSGLITAGCVRRTLTINTEPAGALLFLNDEEVGRTPVTTDFLWYGDYDVIIRHDGYETLQTNLVLKLPWYQLVPIDFFAEVLWPGRIVDCRVQSFELVQAKPPDRSEMLERAQVLRDQALNASE